MPRLVLLACWVVLFAGCEPPATEADVVKNVFGTTENLDLMRSATKITACRITPKVAEEPVDDDQPRARAYYELKDYQEAPHIDVSALQAVRFQRVLASPGTYRFDMAKGCVPVYGVRVRFETDAKVLEVNVCFECSILAVAQEGKVIGGEDFDGGEAELIALAKDLFPNDPEIQTLKPR